MQIARLNDSSALVGENFERRVPLIIAPAVRVMRQTIVITNQVAVNTNGSLDAPAVRPDVFAQSCLNAELTRRSNSAAVALYRKDDA